MLFSLNIFLKNLKKDGYYIIEDYKFPNFFVKFTNTKVRKTGGYFLKWEFRIYKINC